MKKSKIIIPALAMLVMSSAAAVTGTVAWFTMNATAKAEGMIVSAKTSGSLIIKEIAATPALPTTADKGTKVVFDDGDEAPRKFFPSTHVDFPDAATSGLSADNDTGLQYVSNGQSINFETGTRMNNTTTLTYENVAVDDTDYYYDYGVYLAGDGMEMQKNIRITLDNAALANINGAISIDFYGQPVSSATVPVPASANYLDTLNLAKKYNDTQYSSDDKASFTVNSVTIPKSGTTAAYAIIMRVYFDGALIQSGVSNNDFATYTACGASELAVANTLYYTENGGSIVPKNVNDPVNGLYKVNQSGSTKTFARSIEFASVVQQNIAVTFSAS